MDAWCALWYWPLTTQMTPPSLEEWLKTLEAILGYGGLASGGQRADVGGGDHVGGPG